MKNSTLTPIKKLVAENLHPYLENGEFLEVPIFHTQSHIMELQIHLPKALPYGIYEQILHQLRLNLHLDIRLSLETDEHGLDLDNLRRYCEKIVSTTPELSVFNGMHPSFSEQNELQFLTELPERFHEMNAHKHTLEEALKIYGIDLPVVITDASSWEEAPLEVDLSALESLIPAQPEPEKPRKRWSKEPAKLIAISQAELGLDNIAIQGHVFFVENRTLSTGSLLQTMYISDYEDAIVVKRFEGRRFSKDELLSVKKGDGIRISGDITEDKYTHNTVLMASSAEPWKEKKRTDIAPQKRIEWHVHTNFSEMDGVCAIEEFIQTAWDWGMEAVALCDHNVVQAFPMAQHKVEALRKSDPNRPFKILYGCEMAVVDTRYQTVFNGWKDVTIKDAEYVVFDLETTGLSNRLDDIIEFGAVKIRDREVVDRMQFFINPNRALPANIMALTHISQSEVDGGYQLLEAMARMKAFIGDAILVAHNAKFDAGMLNAACRKLGEPEFDNPVIDTLPMAYSLCELKSYRLGSVCRHYGVAYDGEGAHRADYDAEVLSNVFFAMLGKFDDEATLETIRDLDDSQALRRNFAKHTTVFAKNKQGLKELFELVTLAHTKYLMYSPYTSPTSTTGQPRMPKKVLMDYHAKGNLLIGSSCQNGEIFDLAHTRSEKELIEAMADYDYIEIQPPAVYKNLLDRHSINSRQDLEKILSFIIDAARKAGKMVIASGDCHYVHPYQKKFRDVYINAKANGNARHPLYKYNDQERRSLSNPDQHFLTTEEMLNSFDFLDDETTREIVLDNPAILAEQTEELFPVKDKLYPPDIEGSDKKLAEICYKTAKEWYGDPLPEPVKARLDRELDAIIGAGYYVVYYISHLLVKKSNEDGYLVGSRGSVGSSFVATMSGITEVNPLPPHYICRHCHHLEWIEDGTIHSGFDLPDKICPECGKPMMGQGQDIPFETFLGFEGDKVPDIDLNFSGDYQPNAHAFTKTIFGDDHVFRAGTVGTVQEKTAYGYVKGYEEEMGVEPFSEAKRTWLSQGCEGVKRTTGQHPGGIVVVPADMDIHDFSPVQYPANNPYAEWKTTHFDFHQIHDNILKFDILGHVDPTAMKMMERLSGIDVTTLPMNDKATMSIFSSTEALGLDSTTYDQVTGAAGIPEFGTPFVRGILAATKPTTFAELVSISGLSHGTDVWLNNAKDLIDAGTHTLREVIGCRDDIMLDLIRFGMPKKESFTIMESVRKGKGLKPEWEEDMKKYGVPDWYPASCKKIKYMFPKAHAVAYVMMAVRIAWFKVHMPRIYYSQFFSIRCDQYELATMIQGKDAIQKRMYTITQAKNDKTQEVTDKELAIYDTLELAYEMVCRGYHFTKLDIRRSAATEFLPDPDDEKAIVPPFSAVDSLGENVAKSIVAAREQRDFLSKEDLLNRTQLSRTLIDKLDLLGALDGLDEENQMTLF